MTREPFFICSDCGSSVLALSHTWSQRKDFEEVGFVQEDGRYAFDDQVILQDGEVDHQWIAYCGGCGQGVTVEWVSEDRIRVLLDEKEGQDVESSVA